MKLKFTFSLFLLSLFLICSSLSSKAQGISTVAYTPSNPLVCNPITVTTTGSLWCANASVLGTSNTVSGSIIYVNININQPIICLPAILPFTQAHVLTGVSAGTFRVTVRTYLNGTLSDTMSTTMTIGSCCQVNTNFSLSTTAICPGDSITFTSQNTNLLNYNWKIDGTPLQGGITTGSRFNTAGTYEIRLVGNDSTCLDSTRKTIRVASWPIINFTSQVNENCPGSMDGSFTTSVSGGIGAYTYAWSTGDTTPGLSQQSGGSYIVTVSDSLGCASTDTVTITTGPAVIADFIPSKTSQICPGETINFTNVGANGTSFVWRKDGLMFSQATNAFYTFTDTGTFTISLYADDGPACADSTSMTFTVSGPTADFTSSAPVRACPDELIQLTNTSLAATTYTWLNNGQAFAITRDASISFSMQNAYDITLIATDGNCADTTSIAINVSAPAARFSASKLSPLCPGDFATFTNTSTNNISNWWSANGMQFSTNGNSVYTFNDPGMVEIKLVIKDDRCFDSTSQTFNVNALPTVLPDVQDETCEGDEDGYINLSVSGGVPPFVYDWSNGSMTRNLTNLTAGTFSVIIRDPDGCEWTDTYVINTKGGLTAGFGTTQLSNGVQFTDMSDSTATGWFWQFGDGNVSTMQSPLHNYTFNGRYVVCLTARDQFGCADTICDTLDVATSIAKDLVEELAVYPNPTNDYVYLDLADLRGKAITLRLTDPMGKVVFVEKTFAEKTYRINVSQLPQAVYLLSVESDERKLVAKILKR